MLHEPLHGVCVSVGYSDYLELALSHNRPHLDRVVVVTSPEDRDSQRVAGRHACDLVVSEDGTRGGGRFNKGALIERGLQQLPQAGWRVHFDSDVLFPGNLRQRLGPALYDRMAIYGCDRMNVIGWERYQRLIASGWAIRGWEHQHYLGHSIDRAEIGSRLLHHDQGWCPIGFTQIWHAEAEYSGSYRTRGYACASNDAAHDDVQFSLRFDRHKRIFIPELLVAHLITPDCRYGANWKGRRTARFGPPGKGEAAPGSYDAASKAV